MIAQIAVGSCYVNDVIVNATEGEAALCVIQ